MTSEAKHFTGRQRRLKTRSTVRYGDKFSRAIITIGGIGTIIAVLLICVFLVWEVIPLFRSPELSDAAHFPATTNSAQPRLLELSDDGSLGWSVEQDGTWRVFHTADGKLIKEHPANGSAFAEVQTLRLLPSGELVLAKSDGKLNVGRISAKTKFISDPKTIPPALQETSSESLISDGQLWKRSNQGLISATSIEVELSPEIALNTDKKFAAIDFVTLTASGISKSPEYLILVVNEAGEAQVVTSSKKRIGNEMKVTPGTIFNVRDEKLGLPQHVRMSGLGAYVYCLWEDGTVRRYLVRDPSKPQLIDTLDLLPEAGAAITSCEMLKDRTTLLVGDSTGRISAWFPVNPPKNSDVQESIFTRGHLWKLGDSSITQLSATSRNRSILTVDAAGKSFLLFATNERVLAELPQAAGEKFTSVAISPQQNRLLSVSNQGRRVWDYSAPHADVSWSGLFRPVWYEGADRPQYSWDDHGTEPRYSLVPLIFGTLKATFYSMLFGAPLALLAALFTSEFLHPKTKARIKPVIELMASLPSVVIGYVAGMVFAPLLSAILPEVISAFFLVPFSIVTGAYFWQMLPQRWTLQAGAWRLAAVGLSILPGLWLAKVLGPMLEHLLFGKSIKLWLTEDLADLSNRSSAWGGWLLLILPLVIMLVFWFIGRIFDDELRTRTRGMNRQRAAFCDWGKFLLLIVISLAAASCIAWLLQLGADPRNEESGERYSQSNSLLVGIAMGFAIIPLIYTIADDALSTVPNHLRSASLGAGATPWQTAVRIVIPTALSGLFSAVMIGLGRAVGETMIVLMTVGNTPIMEFNIFNGFLTLSASIARGLTEAPEGSSQYRVLFLAALTLFLLTFVINTIAESVRQRFRKRAYEL
jgi:phosphate transport system permease protein